MKAVSYLRISTLDQSRYSLDSQERMIIEYCERNSIQIVATFRDNGAGSDTFDRPNYKALEAFIKKTPEVKYLIIYDYSRFSRNLGEALLKIKELQDKYGISVLTTTDPIDTDFTDPMNFMFRAFQFMQAEGQLHNIRRATRTGMIQAATGGRFVHKAPFGYVNARDERNKPILVIEEGQAEIVRMIFMEYLSGTNIEDIRMKAKEKGFKRHGNSAIQRILSYSVYCGLIPIPPHKGRKNKFATGLHAPLVSEQDFWLTQDRLFSHTKTKTVHKNEEVPLRGVLHCWCGRKVTAGNSRGKSGKHYWYYECPEHRRGLSAVQLHKKFTALLDALDVDERRLQAIETQLTAAIGDKLSGQEGDIIRVTRELKSLKLQIEIAERKYLKGNVSEESHDKLRAELQADLARNQRDLASLNTNQVAYFTRLKTYLSGLGHIREAFERMPLDRQHLFINAVFDNNLYYSNDFYRTPSLHHALSGNELELKQKGLLIIEKPAISLQKSPFVPQTGATPNNFTKLVELLELIA